MKIRYCTNTYADCFFSSCWLFPLSYHWRRCFWSNSHWQTPSAQSPTECLSSPGLPASPNHDTQPCSHSSAEGERDKQTDDWSYFLVIVLIVKTLWSRLFRVTGTTMLEKVSIDIFKIFKMSTVKFHSPPSCWGGCRSLTNCCFKTGCIKPKLPAWLITT